MSDPTADDILDVVASERAKVAITHPDAHAQDVQAVLSWKDDRITRMVIEDFQRIADNCQRDFFRIDPDDQELNEERQKTLKKAHQMQFVVDTLNQWIANRTNKRNVR